MIKRDFIIAMSQFLPDWLFKPIRRQFPLCRYNLHSAVRTRSKDDNAKIGRYDVCMHCGAIVSRDRTGQWREIPAGLFSAGEAPDTDTIRLQALGKSSELEDQTV